MAAKKKAPTVQEAGRRGGKARAAAHTAKQQSAWGKLGGRPRGSGKKRTTKKGAK